MITFTPLSGSARSTNTTPIAFVLQVDDVQILLDCGSPDWYLESCTEYSMPTGTLSWNSYCESLKEYVKVYDSKNISEETFVSMSVLFKIVYHMCDISPVLM